MSCPGVGRAPKRRPRERPVGGTSPSDGSKGLFPPARGLRAMARGSTAVRDPIVVGEVASLTDTSGYISIPTSGEGPGVLVLGAQHTPEEEVRGWCDRLAREGYIALAPGVRASPGTFLSGDRGPPGPETDPDRALARWIRAVERLSRHPGVAGDGVGVLGVGDGSGPAMLLAELKPSRVRAVVVFYGADREVHFDATRAAYLGHFAAEDPFLTEDAVRDLEAAILSGGRDAVFHHYPEARPGFFEVSSPSHDLEAEAVAWARTLEFLRDRLGPG